MAGRSCGGQRYSHIHRARLGQATFGCTRGLPFAASLGVWGLPLDAGTAGVARCQVNRNVADDDGLLDIEL